MQGVALQQQELLLQILGHHPLQILLHLPPVETPMEVLQ